MNPSAPLLEVLLALTVAVCVADGYGDFERPATGKGLAQLSLLAPEDVIAQAEDHSWSDCATFFGTLTSGQNGRMTVVDISAPSPDPDKCMFGHCGPNNFVHFTGSDTCKRPSPPDGCHSYVKTSYSEACPSTALASLELGFSNGSAFTDEGVLKRCQDFVTKREVVCFEPPSGAPQSCVCPA
mmetsp:Transcript_45427/g.145780  ORF Transcript_45427/g.145780 Transcript_45427/m.145780 type:complete len:183 (+) Transcript_45427:61-609(+)